LNAAPMHDVGKIGIPDHILLKPGSLDRQEWEIMKSHAAIGAELLAGSRSPVVQMGELIALTHHERWDGTGYPRGLKGEEIPFVSRITAVGDVFDALISERPYKSAWPLDEARAEIIRLSGQHFDPDLVTVFDGVFAELVEIIDGANREAGMPVPLRTAADAKRTG
jgi:putative two-component system response regulator